MRVRLLRRVITPHADYAIGTVINVTNGFANRLFEEQKAEKYTGEYPPKKKMRTEIFKPK
jgi:hypothetical protein